MLNPGIDIVSEDDTNSTILSVSTRGRGSGRVGRGRGRGRVKDISSGGGERNLTILQQNSEDILTQLGNNILGSNGLGILWIILHNIKNIYLTFW